MSFISETASAIKRRFGFDDTSSEMLPASKDLLESSPILSFSERCDDATETLFTPSFDLNEDPSFWKDRNVQVIIRMRPLGGSELSTQSNNKCVRQDSCQQLTWTGHPETRFTFDAVADENVSQEKIFKVAGLPMVDNCMGGYNSCMFAYGQTGSGKTYTMLGDIEGGSRRHSVNCGITPRIFECLFSRISKEKDIRKEEKLTFTCRCSFLEIYNEQIFDLLDPSSSNLHIREDSKKGVYVENLREHEVASARDVIAHLVQGATNRKVAATNMNRASSRSHSVFTCTIESKWEAQEVTRYRFARLNLVDLAGSERQKSSGAEGDRLKEATNINKSLSTLGLVIMNLVNVSSGKSVHVPYRDSKLTFLLQDSLGGNSKTTIIANISPSNCCALETLSTLKFAQRAKFIKNNAIVNEDASGDVLAMRMQIQQLSREKMDLQNLCNILSKEKNTCASFFPATPEMTHKNDYDVALVGSFRREKDKDVALHALTAENQAAMQLIKQREDEIQGLKMRLRLREAGTKRLEAVAAGKLSSESFLLNERAEHMKEIEVLRSQAERNQEVTRFAMENLQLKEEIKRLRSFYEEGERELLNEQIRALQSKLMEALDWKLLHEQDLLNIQGLRNQTESEKETVNLKPMVDAIATASQREAETNEVANLLRKANAELKMKLNVVLDDNGKLIEMYERAIEEQPRSRSEDAEKVVQNLEQQLVSLHEENDELMGLYEKAMIERDELKRGKHANEFKKWVASMEDNLLVKRQNLNSIQLLSTEIHRRKSRATQNLLDLNKGSLSIIPASCVAYFEEADIQARGELSGAVSILDQKKEELKRLQGRETKLEETLRTILQCDGEVRSNLAFLKSKIGEESGRIEKRKALLTIENTLSCTNLLESELKLPKLQREMDGCRERLRVLKKEAEGGDAKLQKLLKKIEMVRFEVESGLKRVEEAERGVENVTKEKEGMVLEFKMEGERVIMECAECTIEAGLKEEEAMIMGEELELERKMIGELRELIDDGMWCEDSSYLCNKLERGLVNAGVAVQEAQLLLHQLFS